MEFESAGKLIRLYGTEKGSPLIIMNTAGTDGEAVFKAAEKLTDKPFTLAAVSKTAWNNEMSPWPSGPAASWDRPYAGLAEIYLSSLENKIIPSIISTLGERPEYTAIAGYSLGGLFALYSLYRTNIFSRAASISGSLWYPGFADFAGANKLKCRPSLIYFSLGDREAKKGSPVMRSVQEKTESIVSAFRKKGLNVIFEMNPGSHFSQPEMRTAKAIKALLSV